MVKPSKFMWVSIIKKALPLPSPNPKTDMEKVTLMRSETGIRNVQVLCFQIYVGFYQLSRSPTPSLPKSQNGFGEGDLDNR
jgi:hypothetical protein